MWGELGAGQQLGMRTDNQAVRLALGPTWRRVRWTIAETSRMHRIANLLLERDFLIENCEHAYIRFDVLESSPV